jgi:hypothetical protein
METVRLNDKWKEILAQLPESGMGYQVIDVELQNGRILAGLTVFNGEECLSDVEFDPNEIVDVRLHR